MVAQAVTSINCPNCRTPFTAPVQQIIDAQADPEAKSMLLSGQLNMVVCPSCGFRGALNTPFLYHDAELELALVYMPMELGPHPLPIGSRICSEHRSMAQAIRSSIATSQQMQMVRA